MALQDLTPQLRTRLSRMERAVGWFVFLAAALLLFGFGYYLYHTAARKGWFVIKAKFFTYVQSSAGLNAGDPVYMMGFPVGQITSVHPMPPGDRHNVRVEFEVRDNYFRYIWTGGSYVKINDHPRTGAAHHRGNQPLAALPGCPRRKFQHCFRRLHDAHAIESRTPVATESGIQFDLRLRQPDQGQPRCRLVAPADAPLRKFCSRF
jgi:hypothetical protein